MEEDEETAKAIPPWVELEYAVGKHPQLPSVIVISYKFFQHMRILAEQDAQVKFTHLSKLSCDYLGIAFSDSKSTDELASASVHQSGVLEIMKQSGIPMEKVCLLDPKAEAALSPEDGDHFEWFLFGVRTSAIW